MNHCRARRVQLRAVLVGVALATALAGMAAEPASKPTPAPTTAPAVDQNGPVIKDVYRKHFLIGTAGDFPGNYSDAEKALSLNTNCSRPG